MFIQAWTEISNIKYQDSVFWLDAYSTVNISGDNKADFDFVSLSVHNGIISKKMLGDPLIYDKLRATKEKPARGIVTDLFNVGLQKAMLGFLSSVDETSFKDICYRLDDLEYPPQMAKLANELYKDNVDIFGFRQWKVAVRGGVPVFSSAKDLSVHLKSGEDIYYEDIFN